MSAPGLLISVLGSPGPGDPEAVSTGAFCWRPWKIQVQMSIPNASQTVVSVTAVSIIKTQEQEGKVLRED